MLISSGGSFHLSILEDKDLKGGALSGYNKVGIPFIQFRQSYANGGAAEKSALKLTSGRLHLIDVHTASNGRNRVFTCNFNPASAL